MYNYENFIQNNNKVINMLYQRNTKEFKKIDERNKKSLSPYETDFYYPWKETEKVINEISTGPQCL